jgi:acetylglutamate kinase
MLSAHPHSTLARTHTHTNTQAGVITDIVLLATVGIRVVMVHGGGPEINIWLGKVGIESKFKNGLRVTDGELRHSLRPFVQCPRRPP